MRHGKLLSTHYLFETSIDDACKAVGLSRPGGRSGKGHVTVSAHRFRHTVGTQLAERGAPILSAGWSGALSRHPACLPWPRARGCR